MMSLDKVLRLGDPVLHEVSVPVLKEEASSLKVHIDILHEALMEFREIYGAGRAIAAPQIGLLKRFIYMNIDKPIVLLNPELSEFSEEIMEVWDDCLCFPGLLVKVRRSKSVKLTYYDMNWEKHILFLKDDLAELIQHEYDHLDGILATQRAIDNKSFKMKKAGY